MSEQGEEFIYLRLEGPLQAWGETSRWTVRDTRLEPTKSGLVGLLAACLGWGMEDDARIAALAQAVAVGVRADRPGSVVRDYHTVYGGVLSAEGKVKINQNSKEPETVESWRDYLADACFLAAVQGPPALLDEVEEALRRPVWPPFLGRKSCPPALPIYPALPGRPSRGTAANLEQALRSFPWLGRGTAPSSARAVVELGPGEEQGRVARQRRQDVPLSFVHRQFGFRYVHEQDLELNQGG
ncbi:MAG: type I-E CRISPR-associated protein Cas5/CasD [Chloroflexota bacterium]